MKTGQANVVLSPPVDRVTIRKYAELVGVSEAVVGGWVRGGHLPVICVGKYKLVNLVALYRRAHEGE